MMTQSHVLLGAALLAGGGAGATRVATVAAATAAAIAGALLPDADLWVMTVMEFVAGSSGCEIFHYRYFEAPWTSLQAILNSVPLYGLVLAVGVFAVRAARAAGGFPAGSGGAGCAIRNAGVLAAVFAASALLHVCTDFLLHHDDARRHLWPLTDWVFRSPVSYWDPAYHGDIFVFVEIGLGVGLAAVLWRRHAGRKARAVLVLACLGYGLTLYASVFGAAAHDMGPGSCDSRPLHYQRGAPR